MAIGLVQETAESRSSLLPIIGALVALMVLSTTPSAAAVAPSEADVSGLEVEAGCEISPKLVNSCRPWLGASANKYPQVPSGLRSQTEYHEQRINQRLDVVHAYNGSGTSGLTTDQRYFASRQDTILFLNWKPASRWADAGGSNATVNASIDSTAASIKSLGEAKIFLTLHHEPENDVSGGLSDCTISPPGSVGTPDEYRAMWRNVRARFDAQGVANVVWAVNYMSYQPYRCMIDDLYPGNELVDWIFFDNYGSGTQPSFITNVGRMYDFLATNSDLSHDYLSKPWGLAEWNIRKSKATPQQTYDYYDEARQAVETNRFPRLKAYMVWDSITPDGSENRILYQSGGVLDPVSQEHYADFARSWVFTGATAPPPDITAPTPPVIRDVAGDDKGVTINWAASTDDVAVESYDVFRDDQFLGTTSLTSLVDANVYAGMTYSYTVRATDTSQNKSQFSQPRAISVADATPPTVPGTPTGVVNAEDTVTLSWAASTDNVGVSSYQLWRDGQLLATTANTTYVDGTTRQGGTYRYTLYAVDAAGNRSTASTATSVTVPDKLAPTAPTSLVGTSPAKRTVRLTWTASTDNVDVTGYYVYRDTTRIATLSGQATAYTGNSLTSGRTYSFHVQAFDAARLVSPSSNVASVRVR